MEYEIVPIQRQREMSSSMALKTSRPIPSQPSLWRAAYNFGYHGSLARGGEGRGPLVRRNVFVKVLSPASFWRCAHPWGL